MPEEQGSLLSNSADEDAIEYQIKEIENEKQRV